VQVHKLFKVLATTFEQLSMKDRDDVAPDNEDDDNFGLQDVVEDLHSKFQSDFVKLMEPLKDVKKMGREYRGIFIETLFNNSI